MVKFETYFGIILIAIQACWVSAGKFVQIDYFVLKSLFEATDGDNWNYGNITGSNTATRWNFDSINTNPCTNNWAGINCNQQCIGDDEIPCYVTELNLINYGLQGTITESFGLFSGLELLSLDHNSLDSTLPFSVGNVTSLTSLTIGYNLLTGPIPKSVCVLPKIKTIGLSYNKLNDTIPNEICQSVYSGLVTLTLSQNDMSGTVPACMFYSNSSLNNIYLINNRFDGNIISSKPNQLFPGNMDMSAVAATGYNNKLVQLDMSDNFFTGIIPFQLNLWTNLKYFNISHNHIHGHMIISANLSQLIVYDISYNRISGTISSELVNMFSLYELLLSHNSLSGVLPNDQSSNATDHFRYYLLDFSANQLEGTIPYGFGGISGLNTLILSSNNLNGKISNIFSPYQTNLKVLDFNDNGFTGTIPATLFNLSSLESLSLGKNCFTGEIPTTICQASHLTILDFDGLRSSQDCIRSSSFFTDIANTLHVTPIYSSKYLKGPLLSCMFHLPNLTALYLSGNGISGTLPAIAATSGLETIALSHNRLYGSIPRSVQQWSKMRYLDLSYNRFSGTVEDMYYSHMMHVSNETAEEIDESYLGLKSNHLSGDIPQFFHDCVVDINVLEGNMFSCDYDTLPRSDPDYFHYYCGSNYLLGMWYSVFSVVILAFILTVLVGLGLRYNDWRVHFARNKRYLDECVNFNYSSYSLISATIGYMCTSVKDTMVRVWAKLFHFPPHCSGVNGSKYSTNKIHKDIVNVLYLFVHMRRFSLALVIFACIILLPTYVIMRKEVSSYTYTYGWSVSIAFMNGYHISNVMFGLWMTMLVFVTIISIIMEKNRIDRNLRQPKVPEVALNTSNFLSQLSKSEWLYYYFVKLYLFGFIFVDCLVMIGANAVYMYVTVTQSPIAAAVALYVLVLFKTFWNLKIVPTMLRSRPRNWFALCMKKQPTDSIPRKSKSEIRSAATQCMLLVFNNVIAPAIATFFSDSNCLAQFLIPPPTTQSSFEYTKCTEFNLINITDTTSSLCLFEQTMVLETTFHPPFIYSFQCGSALLINYVPVYLLMYGVGGILVPCIQWLVVTILEHVWKKELSSVTGRKHSTEVEVDPSPQSSLSSKSLANSQSSQPMVMRISSNHDASLASVCESEQSYNSSLSDSEDSVSSLDSVERVKRKFDNMIKKLKSYQGVCTTLSVGVISAMHWPLLYCPDLTVLRLPNDPNNRYRIQNTTCGCIAGMGVLLTFGMAYPPLAAIIGISIFSQTYLLQSIITNHLNTCSEHQSFIQSKRLARDASANSGLLSDGTDAGNSLVSSIMSASESKISTTSTSNNRKLLNEIDELYGNNWYISLTAILRKECNGLSNLMYKCSVWMTLFAGLFISLFLYDMSMRNDLPLKIACVAVAFNFLMISVRSWYAHYSKIRKAKKELKKHTSFNEYRETYSSKDVSNQWELNWKTLTNASWLMLDYAHYCYTNYIYYYLFCGCFTATKANVDADEQDLDEDGVDQRVLLPQEDHEDEAEYEPEQLEENNV